jgi:MraZ protein
MSGTGQDNLSTRLIHSGEIGGFPNSPNSPHIPGRSDEVASKLKKFSPEKIFKLKKWEDVVEIPYRKGSMETTPLRHAILFGEYELTIDDKTRMLVPSEIRRALVPERDGDAFFMVVGSNQVPWLYPARFYEALVSQAPADLTPEEDLLAFDQMNFALAAKLEWDKQGRVLIPEKTLRRTGLDREVALVGVRDHLELWNRPAWDARREELIRRSADIAVRAKRARMAPGG